jgi:hypothetical protein
MKRIRTASFNLILSVLLVGCATAGTQRQKDQQNAIQVLQRVDELQNLVDTLVDSNSIDLHQALLINRFCVSGANTLKSLPDGWRATVKSGWQELNKQIPTPSDKLTTTWHLVDAVVNAL